MAIDKVTAYTPVTTTRSNVRYQIRAFYKVTSRTATQATVDLDFQVHFPQYWSSNGSWFKFRTATKSANPKHIRGYYNWYASTGNSPRKDGRSYWLTGQSFNVSPSTTKLTIQVGFSNYQWAVGAFHTQNLVLDIGEGYSDIGLPSAVSSTTFLNTTAVTFEWLPASAGFNNPVKHYRAIIERASDIDFTQNVVVAKEEVTTLLKSTYIFSSNDPNGSFYRAKVSATDTVTGRTTEQVISDVAMKQIPPTMPQLISPIENSIVEPGDSVTVAPLSELGGTSIDNMSIRYRLSSGTDYIVSKYQTSNVFYPPFQEFIGHEPYLSWQVKDGFYTTEWSPFVKFRTGTSIDVAALDFNTTDLVGSTKVTLKPNKVNGLLLSRLTETLKLQWQNEAGTWQDLQSITRTNNKGQLIENVEIDNVLGLIHSQYPNSLNTTRSVPFRVLSTANGLNGTSSVSLLSYKLPKTDIRLASIDGESDFKYSMNSTSPIMDSTITLTINLSDVSANEQGALTINLLDLKTNQTSVLYERSFSGDIIETKSFSPEVFGSGEYKITYTVRYTQPYPSMEEGTLNGIAAFRIADKLNVGYEINTEGMRLDFIRNDSSTNEFNASYNISWTEPRAYVITEATVEIEDDKNTHTLHYDGQNILLFDDLRKYKEFTTSLIRLSEVLTGDIFNITHFRILNETLVTPIQTLQIDENQVNIKITYKIHLKEAFRNSSSATEPDIALLGNEEEVLEFSFIANTICEPEFKDRNLGITFERVLS